MPHNTLAVCHGNHVKAIEFKALAGGRSGTDTWVPTTFLPVSASIAAISISLHPVWDSGVFHGMQFPKLAAVVAGMLSFAFTAGAADAKYEILFNGKNLSNWKGLSKFWSVQGGSILGQTTKENPTKGNTFLVWQGGDVGDFEFLCKVRFEGNNSGVQYRSKLADAGTFRVIGYQADLHPAPKNFGMLYGEGLGRGIIANRGQKVVVGSDGKKNVTGKAGNEATLTGTQWNILRIVAVGNRLIHQVNGVTTSDITDNHPQALSKGILALQLHAGPPMKVEFRNLRLRHLKGAEAKAVLTTAAESVAPDAKAVNVAPASDSEWLTGKPAAQWIWTKEVTSSQKLWFRKSFQLQGKPKSARVYATCDNRLTLKINGQPAGTVPDWQRPIEKDITSLLKPGKNVIAAEGQNAGGTAAFLFTLSIKTADGKSVKIVSDRSWKLAEQAPAGWEKPEFDDSSWSSKKIVERGEIGVSPWRIPNYSSASNQAGTPTSDPLDPKNISTAPGFVVEHVHTNDKNTEGSWVSLTADPQGRFYASDQGGKGLFRITVGADGKASVANVRVKDPEGRSELSGAQGLLWAFDSLWFHKSGSHLYRLTDSDGDDKLDKSEQIPSERGGGEHGNHGLILTEDGKGIYLDGGNHANLAETKSSSVQTWAEDHLLPRMWDANGHARGRLAPGGWVTRLDPKTKTQHLVSIGYRNQYDITLNRFGEMFTYDADMEWDMGSPWYRPTRINHVVSGSDYGWRSGSGKWPSYYEDSLPPVLDIGPGSPTGVVAGKGTKYPAKYQDAIYALDWTYGTIHAIHLKPTGASYTGEREDFVFGTPLPVTDAAIGKDGLLYFTIGGRGTQSAMFRVRYVGNESTAPARHIDNAKAAEARKLRHKLERFHGRKNNSAIKEAWPHLQSEDRFIRNAARVAIESQPANQWAEQAVLDSDPQTRITGLVALARMGTERHRAGALAGLLELNPAKLTEGQFLGLLRAYALNFIRLGKPTDTEREQIIDELDRFLPAKSADLNTELIRVLTYLRSPNVVSKTIRLIASRGKPELPNWSELAGRNKGYGGSVMRVLDNPPPIIELNWAFILRNAKTGWNRQQRRAYFTFLNECAKASGGNSYPGFMNNIRAEALANCTDKERTALADITGENFNPVPDFAINPPQGPGKEYTVATASRAAGGKADFENGRSLYFAIGCGTCHRLSGLGGAIGPDLTSIPHKFDKNYLIEAIVNPSKDISDQYGSSVITLKNGQKHIGLAIEQDDEIKLYPPDVKAQPTVFARKSIKSIEQSPISQMPAGLLNFLNPQEVRDLVAYLMAGGNPKDRSYTRR
ncbi:MAG: putative heme-binding domain-containing protein [Limisphaerales bacterium]|jgi:putative heme-binding domain-containing protein